MKLFKRKKQEGAEKPKKEKKARRKREKVESINDDRSIRPKQNILSKIVMCVLWFGLGFLVFMGIKVCLRPDPVEQYQQMTTAFIEEQQTQKNLELELYAFASNFAKEYCTYQPNGMNDHSERIAPYVSRAVNLSGQYNFRQTATANYAQAYRLAQYSGDQYDVYVMVSVTYGDPAKALEDKENALEYGNTYLKVPVRRLRDGVYIVEDYPLFVAPPESGSIQTTLFTGKDAEQGAKAAIESMLSNFFKAYYNDNQTSIEYYLGSGTDKANFAGLEGRFTLDSITSVQTYQHPDTANQFISVVELTVTDTNGQALPQRASVLLQKEGDRYYVLELDARGVNLKYNNMN